MKKIVIFGGGSGLSQILKGLKLFPVDITAVVSVFDNGASTGRLRTELNTPAVGDITKVLLAMANTSSDMIELMNYRFNKSRSIGNHSVKNLILTALLETKGSFAKALPIFEDILDMEYGHVIPLTEDSVNLVGVCEDGKEIVGEEQITTSNEKIVSVKYDNYINVNPDVLTAINDADLIIFSSGSLLTSIIPHLVSPVVVDALNKAKGKLMYICNLFSQPGETDGFKVSDHINVLNKYLGDRNIDIVVANSEAMNSKLSKKYLTDEQKDVVALDKDTLSNMGVYTISDVLYTIEDDHYRHDSLKTAYLIFSYLMDGEK